MRIQVLLLVVLTACAGGYRADEPPTPTEVAVRELACAPAAGEVALYEHADYRGRCAILRPGDYESPSVMDIDDDAVSSMIVGDDVLAIACSDPAFHGACATIAGSVGKLPNDDSLSSLRVVAVR